MIGWIVVALILMITLVVALIVLANTAQAHFNSKLDAFAAYHNAGVPEARAREDAMHELHSRHVEKMVSEAESVNVDE